MYNMVLADTLKRWHVLQGDKDAKLLTGTDEHGLKVPLSQFFFWGFAEDWSIDMIFLFPQIQQAAASQGMEPQALCDQNCQTFKVRWWVGVSCTAMIADGSRNLLKHRMWATTISSARQMRTIKMQCGSFGYECHETCIWARRKLTVSRICSTIETTFTHQSTRVGTALVMRLTILLLQLLQQLNLAQAGKLWYVVAYGNPNCGVEYPILTESDIGLHRNRKGGWMVFRRELPLQALCPERTAFGVLQKESRLDPSKGVHGPDCCSGWSRVEWLVNLTTVQSTAMGHSRPQRRVSDDLCLARCTGQLPHLCRISIYAGQGVWVYLACWRACNWEGYPSVSW